MNTHLHARSNFLSKVKWLSFFLLFLLASLSSQAQVETYGTNDSAIFPAGGSDQVYTLNNYTMNRELNRFLIIVVNYKTPDNSGFIFDVNYNGGSLTQGIGSFLNLNASDVWYLPISGNNNITSDINVQTLGNMTDVTIHALSFKGVSGNAPNAGFAIANSFNTTNSSINLNSTTSDDLFVDFLRLDTDPGGLSSGISQTDLVNEPNNLIGISTQRGTGNLVSSWGMDNNSSTSNLHLGLLLKAGTDALPVEMSYFSATRADRSAVLKWATETEQDNLGFEIQWSTNGVQWEKLGYLEGHGTSTEAHEYRFVDESPLPGENYYRLKQVDFDGTYTFSSLQIVEFESVSINDVNLFPNPAINVLNIENIMGKAVVYDLLGNVKIEVELDSKYNKIDISNLTPGPHAVRVTLPSGEMHSWSFTKN